MRVTFMKLPGNGEKSLDFQGESWVSVERVLREASRVYAVANIATGNEITVNGETVKPSEFSSKAVYGGDSVVASGTVKGAS